MDIRFNVAEANCEIALNKAILFMNSSDCRYYEQQQFDVSPLRFALSHRPV